MEKLIELLNKYEAKLVDMPLTRQRWREKNWILWRRFMTKEDAERMVISKSFGFIKWLVDNDKIEKYKVIELEHNWIRPFKLDNLYWEIKLEERLLMLLSIQDNPIEFLCSVLN